MSYPKVKDIGIVLKKTRRHYDDDHPRKKMKCSPLSPAQLLLSLSTSDRYGLPENGGVGRATPVLIVDEDAHTQVSPKPWEQEKETCPRSKHNPSPQTPRDWKHVSRPLPVPPRLPKVLAGRKIPGRS